MDMGPPVGGRAHPDVQGGEVVPRLAASLKQSAHQQRDRSRSRWRSMSTVDGRSLVAPDPETRRALELDTLAAILPMDRRDRLAELLTDDDVATLTHLARAGMGANTLRALASDLAYLETWAWAEIGRAHV